MCARDCGLSGLRRGRRAPAGSLCANDDVSACQDDAGQQRARRERCVCAGQLFSLMRPFS